MSLCSFYSLVVELGLSSSEDSFIRRVWTCPMCETKLAVNMAEQLHHQASCKKEVNDALLKSGGAWPSSSQDPALLKGYNCAQCGMTLQLTAIDILKHKREHARTNALEKN